MNKMLSRWLCLLMTAVLLCAAVPGAVAASDVQAQMNDFIGKMPAEAAANVQKRQEEIRVQMLNIGVPSQPQAPYWVAPWAATEAEVAAAIAANGYYMEPDPTSGVNVYTLTDGGMMQLTHYESECVLPSAYAFCALPEAAKDAQTPVKRDVEYVMKGLKGLNKVRTDYPVVFTGTHRYDAEAPVSIPVKDMLNILSTMPTTSDEFAFYLELAVSLGLGTDLDEVLYSLGSMMNEYYVAVRAGYEVAEPVIVLDGMNMTLDRMPVARLDDGTLVTNITVTAGASYTIYYGLIVEDDPGKPMPNNYVITLDISGSMDGEDIEAALLALRTLLDDILADPDNTVALTFFGTEGNVLTLNGESIFSAADGWDTDLIFNSGVNGSRYTLQDAMDNADVGRLEAMLQTADWTFPEAGLEYAYQILATLNGVNPATIVLTDGDADSSNRQPTVDIENLIAHDFGATLVNVTLGADNDRSYLDPTHPEYRANYPYADPGNGRILYYNIPNGTSEELTQEISSLFARAFVDMPEYHYEPQVATITNNVLAAVNANLIDHLPKGYSVYRVEVNGTPITTWVQGVDEHGDPVISFDLGNLYSGDDLDITYFSLPTAATNVKAFDYGLRGSRETMLYAETADHFLGAEDYMGTNDSRRVLLVLAEQESHARMDNEKNILVVSFSNSGNTERLAKYAVEELNADYFEIKPAVAYTAEDLNRDNKSARAYQEYQDKASRPELLNQMFDTSRYSVILVAYPIWFGEEPRIMDTFIESLRLDGQLIVPFCTSEGDGIQKSRDNLKALTIGPSSWLSGKRFAPNVTKNEFLRWLKALNLNK